MSKLVTLLQQAHAIETGAYEAYEGHWRSLKNKDEREKVKQIQKEEWFHRQTVGWMLIDLKAEPNHLLDKLLWLIGKTISISCYFMGYRAAMWGAKVMEVMGSGVYWKLAREATNSGSEDLHFELCCMARQEEEHEKYFKHILSRK